MMKFNLELETSATNINLKNKEVDVETKDGKKTTFAYDNLIIATGAHPFKLPIEGVEKEGFLNLHTLEDGKKIVRLIKKARTACVIGSGLVGLETTESLAEKGIKTTVIEMLPSILPRLLDRDMSREVQKSFIKKGVNFILGKPAEAIVGNNTVKAVRVGNEEVPADLVINAAGVRPNVELAKKAGITIGETHGIKTNIRMQTNADKVYSAGDCAETVHLLTHKPVLPLLGSVAVREGKVAGKNAAGGYAIFPGTLLSWVSKMLDFEVGAVGLSEFWASRGGIEVVVGKISGSTKAFYFPGGRSLKVKLIIEKETKQIIGGQVIGGEEVTQRINALSLAIQKKMTVYELAKADTCYAPSVCETWEPMVLAAEIAIRKLK
jgi:NADH oxidase (H2O2-forming)